jgi:hypothetical protein
MNNKWSFAIVGLVVGVLAVLAYQILVRPPPPPPPPVATGPCTNPNDRCIDVNVIMVAGDPRIQDPGDVTMPAEGNIFWSIKTSGYTFPANGIDFVNTTKPKAPLGEFSCGPMPGNTVFRCHDKHGNTGRYGYMISVSGNPQPPPLDPFIINH